MANSSAGFGFRPFGHRDGSAPSGGMSRYFVSTGDTFPHFSGDLVQMSTAFPGYIANYYNPASSGVPVGVAVGFEYYSANLGKVVWDKWIPAGSAGNSSYGATAYVIDDPEMQFIARVQANPWTNTLIGNCISISTQAGSLSSQGNQTTGLSVMTLNSSTIVTTQAASYPFIVVDSYSHFAPPGTDGTDDANNYNIVVVAPQQWGRKAGVVLLSTA